MKLKLPFVTPAVSKIIVHCAIVFVAAFATQLVAKAGGNLQNWSALSAFVVSAIVAGLSAVAHYVAGLIPGDA